MHGSRKLFKGNAKDNNEFNLLGEIFGSFHFPRNPSRHEHAFDPIEFRGSPGESKRLWMLQNDNMK